MYSNEDLERFYFKYQSEALPHGQSFLTIFLFEQPCTIQSLFQMVQGYSPQNCGSSG